MKFLVCSVAGAETGERLLHAASGGDVGVGNTVHADHGLRSGWQRQNPS